jgi:hypothetical protein
MPPHENLPGKDASTETTLVNNAGFFLLDMCLFEPVPREGLHSAVRRSRLARSWSWIADRSLGRAQSY